MIELLRRGSIDDGKGREGIAELPRPIAKTPSNMVASAVNTASTIPVGRTKVTLARCEAPRAARLPVHRQSGDAAERS